MNMHIRFDPLDSTAARNDEARLDRICAKWRTLHQAAAVVATLTAQSGGAGSTAIPSLPDDWVTSEPWRSARTEQSLDDLIAIMEPGLAALTALHQRGADCSTAARALMREFNAARDALLGLMPKPPGEWGA